MAKGASRDFGKANGMEKAVDIKIRTALAKDFEVLYRIGLATPEFKVSSKGEFMERDEFLSAIENPHGLFLLAENNKEIIGFIYASKKDIERGPKSRWACLVYLVVEPAYRQIGIAQQLYKACLEELKNSGITNVYVWA